MKLPSSWIFCSAFTTHLWIFFILYFFRRQEVYQHNHSILYLFNLASGIFLVSENCKTKTNNIRKSL